MRLDGVLSAAMTSPLGRRVSGSLGLAEAATLRRGRTLPTGPVVLASVVATGDAPDDGLVAEALSLLGISPAPPVIDLPADSGCCDGTEVGSRRDAQTPLPRRLRDGGSERVLREVLDGCGQP